MNATEKIIKLAEKSIQLKTKSKKLVRKTLAEAIYALLHEAKAIITSKAQKMLDPLHDTSNKRS